MAKIINAGVDQFGGENCPEVVVQLVKDGKMTEKRIDESVKRLLRQKFQLGLFDDPYVDPAQSEKVFSDTKGKEEGEASQRRAITLLKNDSRQLPLKTAFFKIYVENVDKKVCCAVCYRC